ncbi:MAG: aminodeoxychorismate lyase [Methylococcaceae bacterium]|nr:aminodeoxychorismate lyase [Methylococcaceae bacterium]
MLLINGHKADHISVFDRGFQYGDGLFETIEVLDGKPVFLSHHLQRLNAGCIKLKIPSPNIQLLNDEIKRVCQDEKSAVLKIIITRGIGGRGYRCPEKVEPTRAIGIFPYPDYPENYSNEGISTFFCKTRLGLNPELAGIKHLNRLEQIMARAEWNNPDVQEGIMLDINGNVIEGTMTNLFYVKNKTVYTAVMEYTGVAGIIRAILKQLMIKNKVEFVEHNFNMAVLLDADEVFVCNSIIGIWPVKQIENISFMAGSVTKQLQSWLSESKTCQTFYET